MKIDILGGSAESKYKALNSQRTINWYIVISTQQEMDKSQRSLFPFPGTTTIATATGRYHRGAFVTQGIGIADRCFFVTDKVLYELGTDNSITTIGNLDNITYGSTPVYFGLNSNNQLFIGSPTAGYNLALSTNTLTAISDTDFPGCEDSDCMDGYLFAVKSGRVYYNHVLNDYTSWDGLDVLTPAFKSDSAIAVRCLKEELYIFGSKSIAVYVNDGTPFSRRQGSTSLYGLAAKNSLCTTNDGHFFIGQNKDGQFAVYLMGYDYHPNQISDFNRTWLLNNKVKAVKNSYAFVEYTKDGHVFYHLTIPELKTTWVYDLQTKDWVERQSRQPFDDADGENVYREFNARFFVNFNGNNLYFDSFSGKIFKEDYTVMTENGNIIKRVRTSQTYDQDRQYISVGMLEIDANRGEAAIASGQGSSPILVLEISRDGGYTFGNPREITMGQLGRYLQRIKINKLGTARSWVLRLTVTDPVDMMIQSAVATGTTGTG